MKILLTGGGTGGHFYPLIAVAEEIRQLAADEKLLPPRLYYMADDPYDKTALFANNIKFVSVSAGKVRNYRSIKNFFDWFKTGLGVIEAVVKMFLIFPDVVFGKGGYASFPALVAARILGIPVVIHDSDSIPGRVNIWAGKFAKRVALSYPDAAGFFPSAKTAVTGNPIRRGILAPISTGAHEYLNLDKTIPVIFVVGGSLGSVRINDTVLAILPKLLEKYQIIHQVGRNNLKETEQRLSTILKEHPHQNRYKLFDFLNDTALRMTAGVADLVVSRAGSSIFEFANWGVPSIIIPIPQSISRDQKTNAFTYARSGAAVVIEEENLSPSVLLEEINRLMEDSQLRSEMKEKAKTFAHPEAGQSIARQLINIALEHEA